MTDNPAPGTSKTFSTIWGKLIGIVVALALLVAIYAEAKIAYRMTLDILAGGNVEPNVGVPLPAASVSVAAGVDSDADFNAFQKQKADAEASAGKSAADLATERTKLCEQRFQAILAAKSDTLSATISAFKELCNLTGDQRHALEAELARLKATASGDNVAPRPTVEVPTTPAAEPANSSGAASSDDKSPVSPPPVTFNTYANADMYGGDISVIRDVDRDACDATCRADSRCIAYSYDSWSRACYPKSAINELLSDPRSITAVKPGEPAPARSQKPLVYEAFHKRAFPKQSGKRVAVRSLDDCEARCGNSNSCAAVTFYKAMGVCDLFDTTGKSVLTPGAESAAKRQYFQAGDSE